MHIDDISRGSNDCNSSCSGSISRANNDSNSSCGSSISRANNDCNSSCSGGCNCSYNDYSSCSCNDYCSLLCVAYPSSGCNSRLAEPAPSLDAGRRESGEPVRAFVRRGDTSSPLGNAVLARHGAASSAVFGQVAAMAARPFGKCQDVPFSGPSYVQPACGTAAQAAWLEGQGVCRLLLGVWAGQHIGVDGLPVDLASEVQALARPQVMDRMVLRLSRPCFALLMMRFAMLCYYVCFTTLCFATACWSHWLCDAVSCKCVLRCCVSTCVWQCSVLNWCLAVIWFTCILDCVSFALLKHMFFSSGIQPLLQLNCGLSSKELYRSCAQLWPLGFQGTPHKARRSTLHLLSVVWKHGCCYHFGL